MNNFTLSDKNFAKLANYIKIYYGIKLTENKKSLVISRLVKRVIELGMNSIDEYLDFVFSTNNQQEKQKIINAITTNKTEFFREKIHFENLKEIVSGCKTMIKVWSAGCSSGEEVYSIAMVLHSENKNFKVLGTDINTEMIEIAKNGVYSSFVMKNLPLFYKNKYLDFDGNNWKIKPFLKNYVRFEKHNLLKPYFEKFDVVFLRNVLIYFDLNEQKTVLKNILNSLSKNGYLFIGLSENIFYFDFPLQKIYHSVYKKICYTKPLSR